MRLLAVGVSVGLTDRRFIPDVGPVPPSYRGNAAKEQDWLLRNREKRDQNLYRIGWLTSVTRMVIADGVTFERLYDTQEDSKLLPAVAAFKALYGKLAAAGYDADSALLYGWRLRETMRVWGTELLSYVAQPAAFNADVQGIRCVPLSFWHRPKNVVSVRNILLSSHERNWLSLDDVSMSLGGEFNPDNATPEMQLNQLERLSALLDLPAALSSNNAFYNDDFNFEDLVS